MGKDSRKKESFESYKNYVKKLKGEYRTAFEKIQIYIDGSPKLNDLEKNNCLLQVIDSFLSGQEEGKSLSVITGTNLKNYCDDMIYGETIHIYKASRLCVNLLGALFYVAFIYFFSNFFKAMLVKDSNLIFQPISFGIAEGMLMITYMSIPYIISFITKGYFEDPIKCKEVRRYTYFVILIFMFAIYTLVKEAFEKYVLIIPFSNAVLIFIYLMILSVGIWLISRSLDDKDIENRENRHIEALKKQYKKHLLKCQKQNKDPLAWNRFLEKKTKENSIYSKVFFVYAVILFILALLMGRGMLVKGIDLVGIVFLIVVCFIGILMVVAVVEGVKVRKSLFENKDHFEKKIN